MGTIYNDVTAKEMTQQALMEQAGFSIEPVNEGVQINNVTMFSKLPLRQDQKVQMQVLIQQVPQALAAGQMTTLYRVSFPEGLPHTLTALKQGGFGSMISVEGQFAGTASFYPMAAQAAALGAFTVMSAATGQYFLAEINKKLKLVNRKLDDILEFLYGDKRAELLAEISFVQYAHKNYASIALHNDQRLATIIGLQCARKVAIQDLEFYMQDIYRAGSTVVKNLEEFCQLKRKALRAKDCIELSQQLFAVSSILEICYAQNFDSDYTEYMTGDLSIYLNRSNLEIANGLSSLQAKLSPMKVKSSHSEQKSKELAEISDLLENYRTGAESPVKTTFQETLRAMNREAEYYIDKKGEVYKKRIA